MAIMSPSQAVKSDDWSSFPAIAAALAAIDRATDPSSLSAAREALRKAELQRDLAKGFVDLWSDWERESARAFGLI